MLQGLDEVHYESSGLERQESQCSSDLQYADSTSVPSYQRQGSLGSTASGTQSITKIAEAANIGMRKLRRNWSQTKTEVRTGFSKMKKKGNGSMIDGRSSESKFRCYLITF